MFELGEDVKVRKARKCFRWSMREGGGDKVCARERERDRQTDRQRAQPEEKDKRRFILTGKLSV